MAKRQYDNGYGPKKRSMKGEYYGRTGQMAPMPRPYVRPAVSGGPGAYASMNVSNRGFLGMERKFLDTALEPAAIAAAIAGSEADPATLLCLNAMAQGDTQSSRDGRKVVLKSVQVKGTIDLAPTDNVTNGDCVVFVALVLDKQTNGAQFNAEDVFVSTALSGAVGPVSQPFRNLEWVQRFEVLATKTISMNQLGVAYNGTSVLPLSRKETFEFYRKLNIPVMFTSSSGTVSSIADNSLHVVAITSSNTAAPTIAYSARVRYVG